MEEKNKQALSDKMADFVQKRADFVQKSTENVQKGVQNEKKSQKSGINDANFEKTYAKCNVCGRTFEIKLRELETKETIVRYFNCTWCRQRYPVYTKHKKRTRRNKKGN